MGKKKEKSTVEDRVVFKRVGSGDASLPTRTPSCFYVRAPMSYMIDRDDRLTIKFSLALKDRQAFAWLHPALSEFVESQKDMWLVPFDKEITVELMNRSTSPVRIEQGQPVLCLSPLPAPGEPVLE